jgi:hypothetical protein
MNVSNLMQLNTKTETRHTYSYASQNTTLSHYSEKLTEAWSGVTPNVSQVKKLTIYKLDKVRNWTSVAIFQLIPELGIF